MGLFDILGDLVTDLIFEIIIELFQFFPIIRLRELALGDLFIELFEEVFPFLSAPVFKGSPRFPANSFLDPGIEDLNPLRRDDITVGRRRRHFILSNVLMKDVDDFGKLASLDWFPIHPHAVAVVLDAVMPDKVRGASFSK